MASLPTMESLLRNMKKVDASDLHLKVGMPPVFRVGGDLRMPQGLEPLKADDTRALMSQIMTEQMLERFDGQGDLDFSTFLDDDAQDEDTPAHMKRRERFRCNVFRAGGGMHAAIRRVKPDIPTFESLRLPPTYQKLSDETMEGLILVVGVTGSGKSTTLACMLERINETRAVNIVTVEDPVEFNINPRMSIVSQREIGVDVPDYPSALKYIVRQDPDVIFIGELRDHGTVHAAIQAAETGHLVFGSLHSADTVQAFTRLVEFFPQHEHAFIRSALAGSLKAVCAQRLLPATPESGLGVVPATEVLISNSSVAEMIREGEDSSIPMVINASKQAGMHSFAHALVDLVEHDLVTMTTALEYAPNREALSSMLKGVQVKSSMLTGKIRG